LLRQLRIFEQPLAMEVAFRGIEGWLAVNTK
jgi:hypothetical protein